MAGRRRIYLMILAVALIVASSAQAYASQADVQPDDDAATRDAGLVSDEATRAQVEALQADWHITAQEALLRLARQDAVGELQSRLLRVAPEAFGGLWIDHANDGHVVVGMASSSELVTTESAGLARLAGLVDTRQVDRSIAELLAVQRALYDADAATGDDVFAVLRIDVQANQVIVELSPSRRAADVDGQFLESVTDIAEAHPGAVAVQEVAWEASDDACSVTVCNPPLRGGIAITGCSAGFMARDNTGALFMMTAAHCGTQAYSHNGVTIGSTVRSWNEAGTSADAQVVAVNEPWYWSPTNWIRATTPEFQIRSTIPTSSIAVGQYVCRTGKVQQNKCGEISDIHYAAGGLFELKAARGVCSGDGDSGGPWWDPSNERAYGINKGSTQGGTTCPKNETAYFSAIRDAETYLNAFTLIKGGDTSMAALRRSNTNILIPNLQTGSSPGSFNFGDPTDIPLYCDWNGDGHRTIGLFRPSTAVFYLRNTNSDGVAEYTIQYGSPGNTPLCGDWDGDGIDTIGVYYSGNFSLRNFLSPGPPNLVYAYGNPSGDSPITGDWNRDGMTTAGIWRQESTVGHFYLRNSHSPGAADVDFAWGNATDTPVVGDWDGDRDDNVGVARLESGAYHWYLNRDNAAGPHFHTFTHGSPGDFLRLW